MNQNEMNSIRTYKKITELCENLLAENQVRMHYPYPVYCLTRWFLFAVTGLVQCRYRTGEINSCSLEEVAMHMTEYFETYMLEGEGSLFTSNLAYFFSLLGSTLCDPFPPKEGFDREFSLQVMKYWYLFEDAIDPCRSTDLFQEFRVCVHELMHTMREEPKTIGTGILH